MSLKLFNRVFEAELLPLLSIDKHFLIVNVLIVLMYTTLDLRNFT